MKSTLLICICLFISLFSYSQKSIELSFQQDARLLLVGDDKGNYPLTFNFLAKAEIPVFKIKKNHISIYPTVEYADLVGGNYQRYAFGAAYAVESLYGKIGATAFFDYGNIYRKGADQSFSSFSLSGELSYKINNWLKVTCTQQLTQRKDLKVLYDSKNEYVISGFFGLKFAL